MAFSYCKIRKRSEGKMVIAGYELNQGDVVIVEDSMRIAWGSNSKLVDLITSGDIEVHDSLGVVSILKATQIAHLQSY